MIAGDTGRRTYAADGSAGHAPLAIVLPESTEQVQAVMRLCFEAGIPVVPRGAGTNFTGATAPVGDCMMVGTTRMRRILAFDPVGGTVTVEAGVRNLDVSDHVRDAGWFYAPDPSSRRTCTIGGNIGTNSGGAGHLRYGSTANNVTALTAVLADGTRLDVGGTAYEQPGDGIGRLLCGSEGQLALVTEACLRLVPQPPAIWGLMLPFNDMDHALAASAAILRAGVLPRQFDLLDGAAIRLCEAHNPCGYLVDAAALLLVELGGLDEEVQAHAATISAAAGPDVPVRIARSAEKAAALWRGRSTIYGAAARRGAYIALDGAVPLSTFGSALDRIAVEAGAHGVTAATVLHAGDGTVHTFLMHAPDAVARAQCCANAIRKACVELGGSVSSEYGVGLSKRDLMAAEFDTIDLAAQDRVRLAFAGVGALNPGKVFPDPARTVAA